MMSIPKPLESHYNYAGEIGWSPKYGYRISGPSGAPHVEEAFARRETKETTKRFGDLGPLERVSFLNQNFVFRKENQAFAENVVRITLMMISSKHMNMKRYPV